MLFVKPQPSYREKNFRWFACKRHDTMPPSGWKCEIKHTSFVVNTFIYSCTCLTSPFCVWFHNNHTVSCLGQFLWHTAVYPLLNFLDQYSLDQTQRLPAQQLKFSAGLHLEMRISISYASNGVLASNFETFLIDYLNFKGFLVQRCNNFGSKTLLGLSEFYLDSLMLFGVIQLQTLNSATCKEIFIIAWR